MSVPGGIHREREKTAAEDGNSPAALIAIAQLKAFEAYGEMTEAAPRLFVVMPAGAKGARRPAIPPQPATTCGSCQTTEALTPN